MSHNVNMNTNSLIFRRYITYLRSTPLLAKEIKKIV
jgi:hypothetical protein